MRSRHFLPLCLLATLAGSALQRSPAEEESREVGYLFEGSFESPEIFEIPEGAKSTILVPYYRWDYGVRAYTKETWEEHGQTREAFAKAATKLADELAASVELDVVRDSNEVVEYILIEDKNPFASSILLSDQLLPRVKDYLGDRVLALIIDRNLIFLFPAVGGNLERYGPSLVADFNAAKLPVSIEVFLLDKDGVRAIGELSREKGLVE